MAVSIADIRQQLHDQDFTGLFIEHLGWDRMPVSEITISADGNEHHLRPIAQKRDVVVCSFKGIPDRVARARMERALAKVHFEHVIVFIDAETGDQVWQWAKRDPGRPVALREHWLRAGQTGEALAERLAGLSVSLDEEAELTLPGVTTRLRRTFDADRVTRAFYDRFKTEHQMFLSFISGIQGQGDREWYASLMLNRLMFVYFIQKKGFLDADIDYLRNRLQTMQARKGRDNFHSFYRHFLLRLFQEGLGDDTRTTDLDSLLGRVPYLNGGLFDVHDLERANDSIEIADEAFETIFDFFDQYSWHLDERPLSADNEINPDVLGYIFEKYVNQKQMGAYYTKEDITGYISKNTIVPFLLNSVRVECASAFAPSAESVWTLLREDPDRYIYPTLRHGADHRLPDDVSTAAPEQIALPSETWRDVSTRRERYRDLRNALADGEVGDVSDLINLNVDLLQLAHDAITNCEQPEIVRAYWKAINAVTVLDPACGSGAFLIAALNILEPLYDACLERMESFVMDDERGDTTFEADGVADFRALLDQVAAHANRRYFVCKQIILNNLFGVDIMRESVEICKLRLFLKLAAQVEPDLTHSNLGIEPLPDIDFNIRAGNSLVGFAIYDDVKNTIASKLDFDNAMVTVSTKARELQAAFDLFREQQVAGGSVAAANNKPELKNQLSALQEELNRYLAVDHGVDTDDPAAYSQWLAIQQPFHWFLEFYGIISSGGFDAIIGNPPYVEVPKTYNRAQLRQTFGSALDRWSRDEDLYTFFIERSMALGNSGSGSFGMILPLSIAFSTKRPFIALREIIQRQKGRWWWSHYDRIPSALFGGDVRTRNTILLGAHFSDGEVHSTTPILRWSSEYRPSLFASIRYSRTSIELSSGVPKVASQIQADTLRELIELNTPLSSDLVDSMSFSTLSAVAPRFPQPAVYVGGTAYNWFPAWRDIPETTDMRGKPSLPARTAGFRFREESAADAVFALLCSSLGYWWWAVASDGFNLKKWLLARFPVSTRSFSPVGLSELAQLGAALRQELNKHYVYKENRGRIGNFFLPACGKEIEAIDAALVEYCPPLSTEFFNDVRAFNQSFSRADNGSDPDSIDQA